MNAPSRFVDRDMFMRFLGIGIGHCSQHTMAGAEPVDRNDSDDDELGGDDGSDQDMADDQDIADDDYWDSEDEDIDSEKEIDDDFGYDNL
jgi:hypothetical protein